MGAAAGDLALTIGATGGVFIGGGIAPRLGPILQASGLRRCFEDKGRFSAYLKPLPIWVIDTPLSPALEGVSTLLD
jgi:glucokinase